MPYLIAHARMAVNVTLVVCSLHVYANQIRKSLYKSFNNILKVMCTNPIILRNPAKHRYGGLEYIKVPCRNCPECARSMQSDYVVRSIALWNTLPQFYNAYFCTLTFRNEDLPKTNVYVLSDDGSYYKTIAKNVPCFNHRIYQRFRKNFSEAVVDSYGCKPYILTTCEYGEKRKRPHYHCIIFMPYIFDWRKFKAFIERFWHYGFTLDRSLACVDGCTYKRSFHNAIEYVTKYVCKYNQWLPFYLKSDKYVTDFPPYDVKPRVFTSKGYGAALECFLTEKNYEYNNVYLGIRDDAQRFAKTYSLPAYYRRRKHVTTQIISSYTDKRYWYDYLCNRLNDGGAVLPYLDKIITRPKVFRKSISYRSDVYCKYLYNDFKRSLRDKFVRYDDLVKTNNDFKLSLLSHFNDCTIDFESLYNKICSIYLERHDLSFSLSLSLPYKNRVENVTKTHYLKLPNRIMSYCDYRIWFYKQLSFERQNGLPFHDGCALPAIHFRTLKCVPYSLLPTDYYKLEYMDIYMRKHRFSQYKLKEKKDVQWYNVHTKPYQVVA